jgi:NAD(P)-dependent dehydrogenase (short-subunit alcohol dehydrogenase family)
LRQPSCLEIHTASIVSALEDDRVTDNRDRFKIRVNTILPGIFPSEMTGTSTDLTNLIKTNPLAAKAVARSPSGRLGALSEIVGPCLLLASPAGGYMNNAKLIVDGGRLMSAGSNDGVRMEDWTYV